MRWDHSITVITGAGATPDPVVAPATVPAANCFRLPIQDPGSAEYNDRVIFGLEAVPAEDVDLELWVLDDADDTGGNEPPAAGRWSRFCEVLRLDGSHDRSVPGFAGGGSVHVPGRGGLCYLRVTRETTANNRTVSVTARPGYDGKADLAMVAGVPLVPGAPGALPISAALNVLAGPTRCWSAVGPGFGPKALAATPAWDDSDVAADRFIAIPAGTQVIRFLLTTSGTVPTRLEVQAFSSSDGATLVPLECVDTVSASEQRESPLFCGIAGQRGAATLANGTYVYTVRRDQIPANATTVQLQACRVGGAADTALLASVLFEG